MKKYWPCEIVLMIVLLEHGILFVVLEAEALVNSIHAVLKKVTESCFISVDHENRTVRR